LATSGTQTLTPTAAGKDTYSLSCSNAYGASPLATATLTAVVESSDATLTGHGGGLDGITLLALAALALGGALRSRRANLRL